MAQTYTDLPGREALKTQAKRLRSEMHERGHSISHSIALETVARQWGFADWNTLSAKLSASNAPNWHVGQRVTGAYLGHAVTGHLKAVRRANAGFTYLTVVFDEPVDVVESDAFTSLRKQVNACITLDGCTVEKTSNGIPHLRLSPV